VSGSRCTPGCTRLIFFSSVFCRKKCLLTTHCVDCKYQVVGAMAQSFFVAQHEENPGAT